MENENFMNKPAENDNMENELREEYAAGATLKVLKKRYLLSFQEIRKIIDK